MHLKVRDVKKSLKGRQQMGLGLTDISRHRGLKNQAKGARNIRKSQKLRKRRERWIDLMEREIRDVNVNKIEKNAREKGKQYVYMLKSK